MVHRHAQLHPLRVLRRARRVRRRDARIPARTGPLHAVRRVHAAAPPAAVAVILHFLCPGSATTDDRARSHAGAFAPPTIQWRTIQWRAIEWRTRHRRVVRSNPHTLRLRLAL